MTSEQKQLLDAMYEGSAGMQQLFASLGPNETFVLLREWAADRGATEASAALNSAGSLVNLNWTIIDAVVEAGVPSTALQSLLTAIVTKLENHDATGLFALLLAHALADKSLRGM